MKERVTKDLIEEQLREVKATFPEKSIHEQRRLAESWARQIVSERNSDNAAAAHFEEAAYGRD